MLTENILIAALGLMFFLLPNYTRPDICFAVHVGPSFVQTPNGRRILWRYRILVVASTLPAMFMGMHFDNRIGALAFLIVGSSIALALANKASRPHGLLSEPSHEAALGIAQEHPPGGWLVAWVPLAFLGITSVYALINFERLPNPLPVHWNIEGADRFVERTLQHVAAFLLILAAACSGMLVATYGMLRWSRRIATDSGQFANERRFRKLLVVLLTASQFAIAIPSALSLFWPNMSFLHGPAFVFLLLSTVFIVIRALLVGQGGSRQAKSASYIGSIGDKTRDEAWKLGLFYFDVNDPALFVEKRFGVGFTLNFGHRWAWPVTALLLSPLIFVALLHHR